MARIPVSGTNDEAYTVPATDVREVISGMDVDGVGRVLWMTWMQFANEGTTTAVVEVYDQDEGAATAANQRLVLHVAPGDTVLVEFPPPGIKFVTNVTAATTGGTIAANGAASGGGYLE